ncbi:MAG TPA: DoxX family protein [Parachlamydiaceae bacterium]|nr:DoxX family protein [Parachlamydiaceae bacterium]
MFYFTAFYRSLISLGNFLQPIFLLAVRLFWGWQFFKAGLGKLDDITGTASFFETLGIPAPELNAYLAASTELVGGLFLMLGLASRLVALPLIGTMIVALLTAHYQATANIFDDPVKFVNQPPFTFLMASAIILIFGPGLFSIDAAIKRARSI